MNKVVKEKTFILISVILVLFFLFSIVGCYLTLCSMHDGKQSDLNNALQNSAHNNYIYNKLTLGSANTTEHETPLFKNSKEAIIFATKDINSKNIYMFLTGKTTTSAGIEVVVESENETWKMSDTEIYRTIEKYQTKGLDMGQTNASCYYIKNSQAKSQTTDDVQYINNEIIATFNQNDWENSTTKNIELISYTINEKTILNEKQLSVFRDSAGKITHYATEFYLNTTLGTHKYAKVVKNNTGGRAKDYPVFNYVKMRAEIDRSGFLTKLYVWEQCTIDVGLTATVTNDFTYSFLKLEKAPTLNKIFY